MIRAWGGLEMAQAAEEVLVKIDAVLPEKLRGIEASQNILSMPMAHMPEVLRTRLDAIETAIQNTRLLTLIYKDAAGQATERCVRPLSQVFWGHVWTLIAWCELRQDFRMFRVDRIEAMTEGEALRVEGEKSLKRFFEIEAACR